MCSLINFISVSLIAFTEWKFIAVFRNTDSQQTTCSKDSDFFYTLIIGMLHNGTSDESCVALERNLTSQKV